MDITMKSNLTQTILALAVDSFSLTSFAAEQTDLGTAD